MFRRRSRNFHPRHRFISVNWPPRWASSLWQSVLGLWSMLHDRQARLTSGPSPDIQTTTDAKRSQNARSLELDEGYTYHSGSETSDLQRADGRAELRFERRRGASRLAHLGQRHPCRILFPDADPGEPPLAVLATLSGGLTGGDRIHLAIETGENACLSATTQVAELIYRSNGPDCGIETHLSVGSGAWMDWLPWPTILFNGARLRRRTDVSVAEGSGLLACECIVRLPLPPGPRRGHGHGLLCRR